MYKAFLGARRFIDRRQALRKFSSLKVNLKVTSSPTYKIGSVLAQAL